MRKLSAAFSLKIFVILLLYALVAVLALRIPMHSDDYYYALMGMSLDRHFSHYLNWSGRFLSDYISTALLSLNYYIYTLINAIAVVLLPALISSIPFKAEGERRDKSWLIVFGIVFLLYWISHPNLGQVNFWIVGAANYLWSNVFIALYLCFLFSILRRPANFIRTLILFISAFASGLSNENTALVIVLITGCILFLERPQLRKTAAQIVVALLCNVAGALILLLSPGNRVRASNYPDWYALDHIDKIRIHVFSRMPDMLMAYWPMLIVLCLLVVLMVWRVRPSFKVWTYAILFSLAGIGANLALAGAPYVLPRAWTGGFVLFLVAIAFLTKAVLDSAWLGRWRFAFGILFLGGVFFIPSYLYLYMAVERTEAQAAIRDRIINLAIKEGRKEVEIPEFYFSRLLKATDKFDTYHSSFIAPYHGLDKVSVFAPGFDFSALGRMKSVPHEIIIDESLMPLRDLWVYDESFCGMAVIEMLEAVTGGPSVIFKFKRSDGRVLFESLVNGNYRTVEIEDRHFMALHGSCFIRSKIAQVEIKLSPPSD